MGLYCLCSLLTLLLLAYLFRAKHLQPCQVQINSIFRYADFSFYPRLFLHLYYRQDFQEPCGEVQKSEQNHHQLHYLCFSIHCNQPCLAAPTYQVPFPALHRLRYLIHLAPNHLPSHHSFRFRLFRIEYKKKDFRIDLLLLQACRFHKYSTWHEIKFVD